MSSELGTEELIFIIRQQEDGQLILSTKHPEHRPKVNGEKKSGRFPLNDRDTIKIASLYILVSQHQLSSPAILPGASQMNENGVSMGGNVAGHSLRVRQDTVPFNQGQFNKGSVTGEHSGLTAPSSMVVTSGTGFTKVRPGELFSEYEGEAALGSRQSNVEGNISADSISEMPDYLQNRIGDDGWEDPLKKRQRAGTTTLFKFDEATAEEREKSEMRTSGAINRSQADLVGVKRFSSPNLAVVKAEEERKAKMYAVVGVVTLLIVLAMIVILFDMYFLSIKG